MLPVPAPGVSRPRASVLMRAMSCGLSARTTRLLVRVSTAIATFGGVPGGVGRAATVSGTTRCSICAMSIAEAFCSADDLHVGAGRAGRSTRMMRWMRAHVLRVVGDDDRVVVGIGGDEVVRGDERAQHRHELHRDLVLQHEDLRHDAVARHARGLLAHRARARLGLGLGHDLHEAAVLDRGVALHAQRRKEDLVEHVLRHRLVGDDVHRAGHARVEDEVAAGVLADRLDHRLDVGVDEIDRDLLVAVGGGDAGAAAGRGRGRGRASANAASAAGGHDGRQARARERLRNGVT